jgi:hypothetical protein
MKKIEIDKIKDLHKKIKNILLYDWDPIGVNEFPEANDEYDSYVSSIYKFIIMQKPVNEIYDYLVWLEGEHMGLIVDKQRAHHISKLIYNLSL